MGRPHLLAYAALLGAGICWGSVVVTIKIAARGIPIGTITVIEVASTLVVLGAVLAARRARISRPTGGMVLAGVIEPGLAYPVLNLGLDRTSGTHGSVIIGLESVLIVLAEAALRRARPTPTIVVAVAVATIGTALVTAQGGGRATLGGDVLVALGVLLAAAYVVLGSVVFAGVEAVTATFHQFLAGGITVLIITAGTHILSGDLGLWGHPTVGQTVSAIVAGVVGSAVAFVLYNWALDRLGPVIAGVALTLIPVFGVAFSAALLGDSIDANVVVGVALVLAGIAAAVLTQPPPQTSPAHDRSAPAQ